MNNCQFKKGESIWPEENDISGDNIISLDQNKLIKEIRAVKREQKTDCFLENIEKEIISEEHTPKPGKKLVKYQDLDKRAKVAYIIDQMEKFKKNDL